MSSLSSMPKRAIVSIKPDPYSPFEFVNVNTAENILNSRHVGGRTRKAHPRRYKRHGGSRKRRAQHTRNRARKQK